MKSSSYGIGRLEVERAEHPAVQGRLPACATGPSGLPHCQSALQGRGEIVKGFVVLGKGNEPSDELKRQLQEHCKEVTAPYKYPREIEFVAELPNTISGKIRPIQLRQRA